MTSKYFIIFISIGRFTNWSILKRNISVMSCPCLPGLLPFLPSLPHNENVCTPPSYCPACYGIKCKLWSKYDYLEHLFKKNRQILSYMSMIHLFCKRGNFEVQRYFKKTKLCILELCPAECCWILSKEALKTTIFAATCRRCIGRVQWVWPRLEECWTSWRYRRTFKRSVVVQIIHYIKHTLEV